MGITSAIKLASNENALGPSPKAIHTAKAALLNSHIYPDAGCFELKKTLSKFLNVETNQLTIGNGSENILEIIVKSYLSPNDAAVFSEYAFITIPLLIKSYGGKTIQVPARDYGHDLKQMLLAITSETRIVFIVNPNNPTGTYTSDQELKHLLDSIPPHILVVIDEAYNEYIQNVDYPQTLALLKHYPNIIITRTFSKIYGLAAMRIGYAISSPDITDILNRARLPFNVNTIASLAARCALGDHDHIKRSLIMNKQGMEQLKEGFKKLAIDFIPSLGNFITIDVKSMRWIFIKNCYIKVLSFVH